MAYQEVKLNRGGCGYIIDDFVYMKDRERNGKIYLKCIKTFNNCKARAVIVGGQVQSGSTAHDHAPPDMDVLQNFKLIKEKHTHEMAHSIENPPLALPGTVQTNVHVSQGCMNVPPEKVTGECSGRGKPIAQKATAIKPEPTVFSSHTIPVSQNCENIPNKCFIDVPKNEVEAAKQLPVVLHSIVLPVSLSCKNIPDEVIEDCLDRANNDVEAATAVFPREVTLNRGGIGYAIGDFVYSKDRERNGKLYLKCIKRPACKGRAIIYAGKVQSVTEHEHPPSSDLELEVREKHRYKSPCPDDRPVLTFTCQINENVCETIPEQVSRDCLDAAKNNVEATDIVPISSSAVPVPQSCENISDKVERECLEEAKNDVEATKQLPVVLHPLALPVSQSCENIPDEVKNKSLDDVKAADISAADFATEVTLHRGGLGYAIGDFLYRKDRERNGKLYLRCIKRSVCKGRAVIVGGKVQSVTAHEHPPSDMELEVREKHRHESSLHDNLLVPTCQNESVFKTIQERVSRECLDAAKTDVEATSQATHSVPVSSSVIQVSQNTKQLPAGLHSLASPVSQSCKNIHNEVKNKCLDEVDMSPAVFATEVTLHRGGLGYAIGDFLYSKDRERNGKVYLRCIKRPVCKGRAVIVGGKVQSVTAHEHPPSDMELEVGEKHCHESSLHDDLPVPTFQNESVFETGTQKRVSRECLDTARNAVEATSQATERVPLSSSTLQVYQNCENFSDTVEKECSEEAKNDVEATKQLPVVLYPLASPVSQSCEDIPDEVKNKCLDDVEVVGISPADFATEVTLHRGGLGYAIGDFLYRKDRERNGKLYLKCVKSSGCKGRAVIVGRNVQSMTAHEHPPLDFKLEVREKHRHESSLHDDLPVPTCQNESVFETIQERVSRECLDAAKTDVEATNPATHIVPVSSSVMQVSQNTKQLPAVLHSLVSPVSQSCKNIHNEVKNKCLDEVDMSPAVFATELTLHRGGLGYAIGDFLYSKDRERNGKLYLRCIKRPVCKGRAVIVGGKVQSVTAHEHPQSPNLDCDVVQFREKLRHESSRPENRLVPARQTYEKVFKEYLDAAGNEEECKKVSDRLPNYTSVMNILYRKRKLLQHESENRDNCSNNEAHSTNENTMDTTEHQSPLVQIQLSKEQFMIWEESFNDWKDNKGSSHSLTIDGTTTDETVEDGTKTGGTASDAQGYLMYLLEQSKANQRSSESVELSSLVEEENGSEDLMEDNHTNGHAEIKCDEKSTAATDHDTYPHIQQSMMESGQTKICAGEYYQGFDELCSASPLAKEAIVSTSIKYLTQDMVKLLQYTKRMRTIESAEDLQKFSWEEVLHEANDLCPDLVTLIDQLLQQCSMAYSNASAGKVRRPNVAIGMILSLLLHYQDPVNYRVPQQMTSLLLHLSGCKEQLTYLSLNHLGLCLGPSSTLDFVNKIKENSDVCETFKTTDMGSLGKNCFRFKRGSFAQRRREKKERGELNKELMEEEMEIENEWQEELRQVAEDIGLEEEDYNVCESDETESSAVGTDDSISSHRYKRDSDESSNVSSRSLSSRGTDEEDICFYDRSKTKNTRNGDSSRFLNVDLEPDSSGNAKSLCYKVTRIDLKRRQDTAMEREVLQRVSGEEYSLEKTWDDGELADVKVEEKDEENGVDTSKTLQQEQNERKNGASGFSNKRFCEPPESSPKRPKKSEDGLDDWQW